MGLQGGHCTSCVCVLAGTTSLLTVLRGPVAVGQGRCFVTLDKLPPMHACTDTSEVRLAGSLSAIHLIRYGRGGGKLRIFGTHAPVKEAHATGLSSTVLLLNKQLP